MHGAYADPFLLRRLVVPMGLGSARGAITGGLLVPYAPAEALKLVLVILLIWSAKKVMVKHG